MTSNWQKSRVAALAAAAILIGACAPTVTHPDEGPIAEAPMFPGGQVEHSAFLQPPLDQAAYSPVAHGLPIRVTVTVGQITDIVEEVGGDRVEVAQVIPGADDPHLFVPTPSDVTTFSRADVIFYNGLFLEGKLGETLAQMERRGVPAVAVTAGLAADRLLEHEYAAGRFVTDPHVWFDPDLWSRAAANVALVLTALDPDGRDAYAARLTTYQNSLAEVTQWGRAVIGTVPESQRMLVTSHDAFQYFGRSFGLGVRGLQGLSTEVEAGTRDVIDLADFLVQRGVPAVFVEASVSPEALRAVVEAVNAQGSAVAIGGELFSDTPGIRGTPEGSYLGMVLWNLATVATALGGDTTTVPLPASAATHPRWDFTDLVGRAADAATHTP